MFELHFRHYLWKLLHWYQRNWNIIAGDLIKKVEPIIFLAVLIQKPVPQSSFAVTLIEEYSIKLNYCGVFIVPQTSIGNFYTSKLVLQEQVKYYQRYQHNHKSNCILLCCCEW
jgi:hypothetical protein